MQAHFRHLHAGESLGAQMDGLVFGGRARPTRTRRRAVDVNQLGRFRHYQRIPHGGGDLRQHLERRACTAPQQ